MLRRGGRLKLQGIRQAAMASVSRLKRSERQVAGSASTAEGPALGPASRCQRGCRILIHEQADARSQAGCGLCRKRGIALDGIPRLVGAGWMRRRCRRLVWQRM